MQNAKKQKGFLEFQPENITKPIQNNNECLRTEDSSTKIDGKFFSVARTTPFAATTPIK